MSITEQEITRALNQLELGDDVLVMIHSSLRAFGHVGGGAETMVKGCMRAFSRGTIVMPTYTERCFDRNPERDFIEFNPGGERSIVGAITECFRKHPEVIRQSNNPWHPMAAWGERRKAIVELPMYGTYTFFIENNGYSLLMGIGHEAHSFVHHILDDAEAAGLLEEAKSVKSCKFPRLDPWFEKVECRTKCGEALLKCGSVKEYREAAFQAFSEEPDIFAAPPTEQEAAQKTNIIGR